MPATDTPFIGITTYGRGPHNRFILPAEYVDAVRRAGGIPLLLPPGEERMDAVLPLLKAVVFSGGGDLDPDLYGGSHHETIYMVEPERDRSEIDLARRVFDLEVPTLAICRGSQILNVAKGGTLIEHLPDEVGETVNHRVPPREPTPHAIRVEPASRLAGLLGATDFSCMSWHHQAIRHVAPGFEVVAHAPDGTIEGLEMPSHPWLVGVQWHPELTAAEDPIQQRLFDALVEAAGTR
ncbi:MAG: gamma-glutamyl-gamma-aminobutyrate hydrolase family protein [Deltaproteobacteria bacterium]|nr:gamma-glutamyl-gamma-aminobutyrate hydrolase family protein [Deltaproteobacteria bacterium]